MYEWMNLNTGPSRNTWKLLKTLYRVVKCEKRYFPYVQRKWSIFGKMRVTDCDRTWGVDVTDLKKTGWVQSDLGNTHRTQWEALKVNRRWEKQEKQNLSRVQSGFWKFISQQIQSGVQISETSWGVTQLTSQSEWKFKVRNLSGTRIDFRQTCLKKESSGIRRFWPNPVITFSMGRKCNFYGSQSSQWQKSMGKINGQERKTLVNGETKVLLDGSQ